MNENIPISKTKIDNNIQAREALDFVTVAEYAEAMRNGASFPPVDVFFDGDVYWLGDGNHRLAAAKQLGLDTLSANVRAGTKRDAILYAVGTNADHGLPRKPEDKRRAVTMLLTDSEWCLWADRQIARQCKVSHTFVAKLRATVTGNVASENRSYITKHGTLTTMNTANIGGNGNGNGSAPIVQSTASKSTTLPISFPIATVAKSPRLIVGQAEDMHQIQSESVDLIITSPPYNLWQINWSKENWGKKWRVNGIEYDKHNDSMPESDYQAWQLQCLIEMYRVAKPGASLFYNHKIRTRDGCMIHPMAWIGDECNPWTGRQRIVWNRGSTHQQTAQLFNPIDEEIYWLTKGKPALPDRPIKLNTVWQFTPAYGNHNHPAPFPDELPRRCLQAVGRPGIVVLDPFAGSCTTLEVALSYGCEAIGVDISREYLEDARQRNGWTQQVESLRKDIDDGIEKILSEIDYA